MRDLTTRLFLSPLLPTGTSFFGLRCALRAGLRAGSGSGSGSGSCTRSSISTSVPGGDVAGSETETVRETLVTWSKGRVRNETKSPSAQQPSSDGTFFHLPSSMSIIARKSLSASVSGVAAFAFALYAALGRAGGTGGFDSSSSSSEMTTPLLTRAALLGSVRVDDDGLARSLVLSSSESESLMVGFLSTGG